MRLVTLIVIVIALIAGIIFGTNYLIVNKYDLNKEIVTSKIENDTTFSDPTVATELDPTYVDDNGVIVPVPEGFIVSDVTGENLVKNGLVIYEGTDKVDDSNVNEQNKIRNQYVWVPVSNTDEVFAEFDFDLIDINDSSFKSIVASDMKSLKDSIKEYGGFYISRYELSSDTGSLKSVKNGESLAYNNWSNLYLNIKDIYSENDSLDSIMIPTDIYDDVLNWFSRTQSKTQDEINEDSKFWGNYKNSAFIYVDSGLNNINKSQGEAIKIPSGSAEITKINNIYDLAGNMWEWASDLSSDSLFVIRGGGYNNFGNISAKYLLDNSDDTAYEKGARSVLIVK